ncbi:OmpA family protein [Rhodobacterales bacterium HKCCE3408]|nr:OmpA family protein [Rhodobacterales bacterium HKCCE3408]
MRSLIAALCLQAAVLPAAAQDVTLTSQDGAIELSGSLLSFDGEFYRVDSIYGPLTVSAEGVRCEGPGCPDLDAFVAEARFAGASAIAETLLPALIEAFAYDRDLSVALAVDEDGASLYTLSRADGSAAARLTIRPATTEAGFLALLNSEADIALALREPLRMEELAARAADGAAPSLIRRARIIGLDALVPVTSRAHPFREITPDTLARLFTGEIADWSEIGGPEAPVVLHMPLAETGLAQAFTDEILAGTGRELAGGIVRHADLRDLSDAVARDPQAIGVTAYSSVGNARALALSGDCGFALGADPDTLKSEDYPLTAPLYAFTAPRRLPRLVREFLDFLESPAAERVIRRTGFVSQTITETPVEDQGRRLANAILAAGDGTVLADLQRLADRMETSVRLSPTFRFSGGATELDTQSLSAVSRLARAIEAGDFDGRTLIFVGFSDGAGTAATNLRLSRNRAEAVRRAVMEAAATADLARVDFRTAAFGEALPIACDDSEWGRAANRRVEVWLE